MNNKKWSAALIPALLAAGVICGIFIGRSISEPSRSPEQDKLRTIMSIIRNEYVDEIDMDSLLEMTLPDLISSLDPHSVYIPASELTAVNDDLEASFSGVGVSFQILNDTVTVIEVIPGGPAEKVGMLAGDRIIEANGKKMTGSDITSEDVFKNLRGPKNTKVKLKVVRNGVKTPVDYDVIRGEVPVNSVDAAYIIEPEIGYIKVGKFARNTAAEFFEALGNLKSEGAKKYIVDMRDNTGGFLEQAILMVNEFLPDGKTIVYTKGRNPENDSMAVSDGTGSYQDVELVVLTNEISASAAEIFAGAMQDNDRALVIGRRTFGKGLVQNQIVLPDSSAIRLTVARYYIPSGRCIQKDYNRGKDGNYDRDILDRYNHGEFYSQDSIKIDKSKVYYTSTGRKVYGGGGIMPDIFVPQDTTGVTSYYMNVTNKGLIQKYSFDFTDRFRSLLKNVNQLDNLLQIIPDENVLIQDFAGYAEEKGDEPARWYYINQSHDLLIRQLQAMIARDVLGYDAFFQLSNRGDKTIQKALEVLKEGKSPTVITK